MLFNTSLISFTNSKVINITKNVGYILSEQGKYYIPAIDSVTSIINIRVL